MRMTRQEEENCSCSTITSVEMAPKKKTPAKKAAVAVKKTIAKNAPIAADDAVAAVPKGGVLIEACKS